MRRERQTAGASPVGDWRLPTAPTGWRAILPGESCTPFHRIGMSRHRAAAGSWRPAAAGPRAERRRCSGEIVLVAAGMITQPW